MSKEILPFSQFYTESINDKNLFKAVFMVGAPGSGKSFISGKMFGGMGAVTLNSDDIFEMALFNHHITGSPHHMADTRKVLQVKRDMKAGKLGKIFTADYMANPKLQDYREDRVKPLTAKRFAFWINGMLPIIIDGTGKDVRRLNKQVEFLEAIGYDVSGVYIDVDLETSIRRNRDRYRNVKEDMLRKTWEQIKENGHAGAYAKIFDKPGRGYKLVDAEIDLSETSEPSVKVHLKQLQKAGTTFIASALRNPIGKDIIKTLKATKGKYYQDAFPIKAELRKMEQQWTQASWNKKK